MAVPAGLTYAFSGLPYDGSSPHAPVAYLVGEGFDPAEFPDALGVAQENDLTLAPGFDYAETPGDGVDVATTPADVALNPPTVGSYLIYTDQDDAEGNLVVWGWNPFDPANTGEQETTMAGATPANPPVAGSKNLRPHDVNAPLPDRLEEHSGKAGSKMVPYTYANGQLAPGYTPTRSPNTQAGKTTPGAPLWGGESGPSGENHDPGHANRLNVFTGPKADQLPRDVNAPAVTFHTPVRSTGSNTPKWGGGPPPATVSS